MILLYAIPAFLLLVLFEKWYGWRKGHDTVRNLDMVSSLCSGITNVTKDVLGLSVVILGYGWLVQRVALVHINASWLTYVIAFIVLDFAGYWVHRIDHKINIFWNEHIVHHSSEEFNLACALRQSISSIVKVFSFLLLPAALLGVPASVIAIVAPIQLFAQFWYHTRHIGKMGFLEKILVTPSHHRVHHAINAEYLDKNLSQVFIIWDKLFGTFQEELPHVPPVYGITRPAATWNPIKINFQHLWLLIKDAWRTGSLKDKVRIWFMPTGWRPADVEARYPVYKIEDVYHFTKYDTPATPLFNGWAWVQMISLLFFICYLFGNIASIGSPGIFVYGAFIFLFVYAFTDTMDGNKTAIGWEATKCLLLLSIIGYTGDWFAVSRWGGWIKYGIIAYGILSLLVTAWFLFAGRKPQALVINTSTN
ncbi:MAG: hypothetical protein RL172_3172 [Bacteroidota bacterium]